jgi:hypothetical protein
LKSFFSRTNLSRWLSLSLVISQGIGYWKFYLYHLFVLLSLPSFFVELAQKFKPLVRELRLPLFLLTYTWMSLAWTTDRGYGLALVGQLSIGFYFILYFELFPAPLETILKTLRIVYSLNLIISFLEAVGFFRYPISQYSEFAVLFNRNYQDWSPSTINWPSGFYWNPNNNGFFIILFAPIFYDFLPRLQKIVFAILTSFIIYRISSKLILIGWIFCCCYFFFQALKLLKSKKTLFLFAAAAFLGIILTICVLKNTSHEKYSKIIFSLPRFAQEIPLNAMKRINNEPVFFNYVAADVSLHERLMYVDGIFLNMKDHWLFGLGGGSLNGLYHEMAGRRINLATPHFYALELIANYGLLFFIFYCAWMVKLLSIAYKTRSSFAFSLLVLILFNPVMATINYFLPQWCLYRLILSSKSQRLVSHGNN